MSTDDSLQQQIIAVTGNDLIPEKDPAAFKQKLAAYINDLINNNFEKLISILYRLDVSEKKLKQMLAANNQEDAGLLIASCIIERQVQKSESRKKFMSNPKDIPEDEKW